MRWTLLFLFFVAAETVAAVGVGVAPSKIEYTLYKGEEGIRQLILYNPSKEDSRFVLSVNEYSEWFTFPETEVIPAGESQKRLVTVRIPEDVRAGSYPTSIRVVGKNQEEGLTLEAAALVEVEIQVTEESGVSTLVGSFVTASIVGIGLAGYGLVNKIRLKRKLYM